MKQKCPTYLKTIEKSKALTATLSDTEPEDDFDNEDDGILNAFTTTLGLRRETLKSLSRKSSISVITVEQLDILDLIAISG